MSPCRDNSCACVVFPANTRVQRSAPGEVPTLTTIASASPFVVAAAAEAFHVTCSTRSGTTGSQHTRQASTSPMMGFTVPASHGMHSPVEAVRVPAGQTHDVPSTGLTTRPCEPALPLQGVSKLTGTGGLGIAGTAGRLAHALGIHSDAALPSCDLHVPAGHGAHWPVVAWRNVPGPHEHVCDIGSNTAPERAALPSGLPQPHQSSATAFDDALGVVGMYRIEADTSRAVPSTGDSVFGPRRRTTPLLDASDHSPA